MGYNHLMAKILELMVSSQVADILGVSRKTVWEWAKDGIIVPAARTTSSRPYLLFDPNEVARMASVLHAAEIAKTERDRIESEQSERRRLERIEQLKTTNPGGVAKAERLKAFEGNEANDE